MRIGITRRLDRLGRIVIPKEMRKTYRLCDRDTVEIIGTEEGILLRVPQIEITRKHEENKNE